MSVLTVAGLIAELKKYDGKMLVVKPSQDGGGYDRITGGVQVEAVMPDGVPSKFVRAGDAAAPEGATVYEVLVLQG